MLVFSNAFIRRLCAEGYLGYLSHCSVYKQVYSQSSGSAAGGAATSLPDRVCRGRGSQKRHETARLRESHWEKSSFRGVFSSPQNHVLYFILTNQLRPKFASTELLKAHFGYWINLGWEKYRASFSFWHNWIDSVVHIAVWILSDSITTLCGMWVRR